MNVLQADVNQYKFHSGMKPNGATCAHILPKLARLYIASPKIVVPPGKSAKMNEPKAR